jgi:hypothetical protein
LSQAATLSASRRSFRTGRLRAPGFGLYLAAALLSAATNASSDRPKVMSGDRPARQSLVCPSGASRQKTVFSSSPERPRKIDARNFPSSLSS